MIGHAFFLVYKNHQKHPKTLVRQESAIADFTCSTLGWSKPRFPQSSAGCLCHCLRRYNCCKVCSSCCGREAVRFFSNLSHFGNEGKSSLNIIESWHSRSPFSKEVLNINGHFTVSFVRFSEAIQLIASTL